MNDPHHIPGRGERRRFGPPWPEEEGRRGRGSFEPAADLRALSRLLLCLSWFLARYPAYLARRALAPAAGRRDLEGSFRRGMARELLRLAGIRLRIRGEPPRAPALLVANHLSWLDALLILAAAAPVPVTLERRLPIYGPFVRSVGAIVIRRSTIAGLPAVVKAVAGILGGGGIATFHPEGTTGFGVALLPFHAALFQAAVDSRSPLACACIAYRVPPPQASPERSVHWVDWTPFPVHFWRLLGLSGLEARLGFGAPLPPPRDRRSARDAAAAEIARLCAACPPVSLPQPR